MPEEIAVNAELEGVPSDFEAYEKWADERDNPTTDAEVKPTEKPAAATEKPVATKTAPASDPDVKDDDEEDLIPQKKSGFQRRVDKLNQKIGERDARIAELERLATQGGIATRTTTEEKPAAAAKPAAAEGEPKSEDFDTYELYVKELVRFERKQEREREAAESSAAKARETATSQAAAHAERLAATRERIPDFDEVVLEAGEKIAISQAMHEVIIASERGPELAYALGKNLDECRRIASLPPLAAARELGKIEASLDEKTKPVVKAKPISKAPAPVKTLTPEAESSEPDPTDFGAWERWRNKQPGASLRR